MKVYFHGDVVLKEVGKLPEKAVKKERDVRGLVLAEGEVTGHYHAVKENGELYEKDGVLYLETFEDTTIFHQEHKPKFCNLKTGVDECLPTGIYEICFPREYDHVAKEARKVQD